MRLALQTGAVGQPGPLDWQQVGPGIETGELPVLVEGREVDRILLTRLDPERYRLIARNAPAGQHDVGGWIKILGAVAAVNGSYYALKGTPDTPFLSDHTLLGPQDYDARHGALVVDAKATRIVDLAHRKWQDAFKGADDALVSYPLLVGGDPGDHQIAASDWLANRTFVATDRAGLIILGTTKDAFFSLARLSEFLKSAPLDLVSALNLDGGPVACQATVIEGYDRRFCGHWETRVYGSTMELLTWWYGSWGLPIVLAAVPR
jgi:hypothetical protein